MTVSNTQALAYKPLQLRHRVLNRWLVSGVLTRHVRFEPMTMEGDINDWLIKGFSIHENPCRREFVEERRASVPEFPLDGVPAVGESVSRWESSAEWEVYFPWGNPRVETSGFYYVPTHMLRYAYTTVVSPAAHRAVLNIKTCGGVALWVNGKLQADFTPFTRNIEQLHSVEVELQAGDNEFVVLHEDLAERDTLYHFTIEYTGGEAIQLKLPLPALLNAEEASHMERALTGAYLTKDSFADEDIVLQFTESFERDVEFVINYSTFIFGYGKTIRRVLPKGSKELVIGHTRDFGTEYKQFEFQTVAGGIPFKKVYGLEMWNRKFEIEDAPGRTVAERKRIALECVAEKGNADIHTAIAKLKTGGDPETTRKLIEVGLAGIRERRDCADFYLISLFRFWRDYRDSGLFADDFWDEIKETMLGFRYWIDEPGDDVMWFFSENHALLFHSCQLLAGQLFPADLFTNSGERGEQRRAKAEAQLHGWFERFFEEGLAEWNSNAYIPIDILGLVNLYDLAWDAGLREKAGKAMDLLYAYMTAEAHNGILATTFGRSYEKELIGNHGAGTTSLMWVAYGVGNVNNTTFHVSLYLSDYEPPASYGELQRLGSREAVTYRLEQGKDGYAKLYHYRTAAYALGSIDSFRPGLRGYQEHIAHLVLSSEAQVWINHPGELYPYGAGRPSFWAGNGYLPKAAQHRGLAVLLYDIGSDHDADYTHAYFPLHAFDRTEQRGNWYFGEANGAYAAVYAENGLTMTEQGALRARELVSAGRRNVWLLRGGDATEFASFEDFVQQLADADVQVLNADGPPAVTVADPVYGSVKLGWNEPLAVGGEAVVRDGAGVRGSLKREEISR
ncbi:hypothetical protein ACFFK0_14720 [Paenibacillus chartarius]|uniref:Uncharacterized protein n=1 Tax=Paenibacillus chartarius TaxID=747481 RepID=A0ABV6DM24_9BACL